MRCVKPFVTGKAAFGCGQCMPCRLNRRRIWLHRMLLEATNHEENAFITLTYDDKLFYNPGGAPKEVSIREYQLFLKRLRKRVGEFRYFLVGEYGDEFGRPHYHAVVFGYPPCRMPSVAVRGRPCTCGPCSDLRSAWGLGFVLNGYFSARSASYVAGYVTKKMTYVGAPGLNGRHPEFARMSLSPGIGVNALWDLASAMMRYDTGHVPSQLYVGPKLFPLGRYLRRRLGMYIGMSDEEFKRMCADGLRSMEAELQLVRKVAFASSRSVASVFNEVNTPFARALEAREKMKRKSL